MNQHLIHNRAVSPSLPDKTPSVPKPVVVRATTEIHDNRGEILPR